MVGLVVVAQVLLVLEDLVAVLALEDVVVLVSLLVPLPAHQRGDASPPVLLIRIRIHFGWRDPDPHWEYGSGSRRAK